jgi:primosomal protein N' (replication factor Y) (superfamily II helicase)
MSTHDPADMLPGLRDSVADARARAAETRRRKAAEVEPAAIDPVAQVLVDVPLAHLDRPFDYAVPAAMADTAVPGARVKVRFAGQDVDGFVLARTAGTAHTGRLQPLRRSLGAEPVLAPEIADLTGLVARRYAGARADVLRLAVPPRHARTEAEPSPRLPAHERPHDAAAWSHVTHGTAWLRRVAAG